MRNRFNKNQIPPLTSALGPNGSARELFWVAHHQLMHHESYSRQQDRVLFAYERAAHAGDDWAMHALAMNILNDPTRFPEALSWFHYAIRAKNENCIKDVEKLWDQIYHGVFTYNTHDSYDYPDLEVRCALMTDLCLLRLGADRWCDLDDHEKESRITKLCHEASILLSIPNIEVDFYDSLMDPEDKNPDPSKNNIEGVAYIGSDKISIKRSIFDRLERVIQIVFHELGHHVIWYAMDENYPDHIRLLHKYGLTKDRIKQWKRHEIGYEISLTEEDPDTLSYGVWWTYLLYFGDRGIY